MSSIYDDEFDIVYQAILDAINEAYNYIPTSLIHIEGDTRVDDHGRTHTVQRAPQERSRAPRDVRWWRKSGNR